ncbi:hypothetical protein RRG08_012528 [Elysia crispata]|uniref:Uncharacterized protein n=1 Tax=Elysia crispata TaxID=231223 RepID=A0AAE1AP56_9GAST|nr:hypothetical protein RRG08_012528 [Elysia crispata]
MELVVVLLISYPKCILKDRPALQSAFSDVERHLREPGLAKWQLASEKKHVSPQTVNMSHNFPPIVIIKSFVGYEKMYGLPWPLHIVNGHGQCKCLGSQSVQDIVWMNIVSKKKKPINGRIEQLKHEVLCNACSAKEPDYALLEAFVYHTVYPTDYHTVYHTGYHAVYHTVYHTVYHIVYHTVHHTSYHTVYHTVYPSDYHTVYHSGYHAVCQRVYHTFYPTD